MMAGHTEIDWTDATPNPFTWRCTPVSEECDNCYASTLTERWQGKGAFTSGPPTLKRHKLLDPWHDPEMRDDAYRKFLASMSDPFHGRIFWDDQALVVAMMAADHRKVYQVATKRAGIMRSRLSSPRFVRRVREHLDTIESMVRDTRRLTAWRQLALDDINHARRNWTWPLPNVWWGVSVGTAKSRHRIEALADTPAAVRFLSCEPLLEYVDITEWTALERDVTDPALDAPDGAVVNGMERHGDTWVRIEPLIHWVIAGGESGGRHRPLNLEYARSLRDQCRAADVPFWFKQVGGLHPKSGGDLLDGRRHKVFPYPRQGVLV